MSQGCVEIFAEDIDAEQWQMLLRFTYGENINRYLSSRNAGAAGSDLADFIAGCVTQSHEYFSAAKTVTLNTTPLLYYYGATNLLAGICALLDRRMPKIQGDGLNFEIPERLSKIADLKIIVRWTQDGAFRVFCDTLAPSVGVEGGQRWTLMEILGSIPELKPDFEHCYPDAEPYVIPVETVRQDEQEFDRIALSDVERFEDKQQTLARVENLAETYLSPNQTRTHLVLRRRLRAKGIGVHSISGRKFLQLSHAKGSKNTTLPIILYCFNGLYVLGFVSRYHPQVWTPFVRTDDTGERDLIQRFVRMAARIVPNLALNALYQKRLCFVLNQQGTVDLSERITPEKIKKIVRSEIEDR